MAFILAAATVRLTATATTTTSAACMHPMTRRLRTHHRTQLAGSGPRPSISTRAGRTSPHCRFSVDPGSLPLAETLGDPPARIALTRELGKNDALREALQEIDDDPEVLELPCVATLPLPGAAELAQLLGGADGARWAWVIVTSPEGASFLVDAWRGAGCPAFAPRTRLAGVGRATGDALRAVGLDVDFTPSKATGATLVREFASAADGEAAVLYAVSGRAGANVQRGLEGKGYEVRRVDTYTTVSATLGDDERQLAVGCDVVTFASPSAVQGWVANMGAPDSMQRDVVVACIGETSANAARAAGFSRVRFADRPGVEGWVVAVCEAMKVVQELKAGRAS